MTDPKKQEGKKPDPLRDFLEADPADQDKTLELLHTLSNPRGGAGMQGGPTMDDILCGSEFYEQRNDFYAWYGGLESDHQIQMDRVKKKLNTVGAVKGFLALVPEARLTVLDRDGGSQGDQMAEAIKGLSSDVRGMTDWLKDRRERRKAERGR